MTTTLPAHGSGAQPARIDTSGKVTGGAAMRVYGFASEAEAQAAGFVCEGGPAMSVAIITDAQIASGAWKLDGDPFAVVIYTAPDSLPTEGGFAVPVYPVNGWGSAPAPSDPQFSSAEIGTVNASTLDVTFDQDVSASDYSDGVTIKVNGTATSITSATRQSNHAIVRYVIPVLWHGADDDITWEYASGSGSIVAESGGLALEDVTAQSVTNNTAWSMTGGFELQADTLALNDNDPVSLWEDQFGSTDFYSSDSGNRHRPIYKVVNGYPTIQFVVNVPNYSAFLVDAPNTILNDVDNFTIIAAVREINSEFGTILSNDVITEGIYPIGVTMFGGLGAVYTNNDNYLSKWIDPYPYPQAALNVQVFRMTNKLSLSFFYNGSAENEQTYDTGTVTTYHILTEPTWIGVNYNRAFVGLDGYLSALLVYNSVIPDVDIQALSVRLAARYGVTL